MIGRHFVERAEPGRFLVVCRDPKPRPDGRYPLSLFVVPTATPGLSWGRIDAALRQPEQQFTVFFDDVRVGADALIGQRGHGLRLSHDRYD
jgi:alkylation response protein AidB-like acyl-CoA dehydrogenase